MLITLQTIFSTGLVVLEPTQVIQRDVALTVTTTFNGRNLNSSAVGAHPAQQIYGVAIRQLEFPVGTSGNLVVQNFELPTGLSTSLGSTYTAEVQGFSAGVDCEVLQLTNATEVRLPWFSIQAPYFLVNVTTDSCSLENVIVGQGADHGDYENNNATENYQGTFGSFTCNAGIDYSSPDPPPGNSSMDQRFFMAMTLLQWTPHSFNEEASAIWVERLTGVLCKPIYSVDNYSVTYAQTQSGPVMQAVDKLPDTNSTLKGFDASELSQAVQASFQDFYPGEGGEDFVVVPVPSFFQVMEAMNNASTLKPLLDPNLLLNLGSQILNGVAVQTAYQYFLEPTHSFTNGSLTYMENRLQVKTLTVGLMATCLGLLVCLSAFEIFVRPHNTVTCDPKLIGSNAIILKASKSFRRFLTGTGSVSLKTLERQLSRERYQTAVVRQEQESFVIVRASSVQKTENSPSVHPDLKMEWWQPIPIRGWFVALAIIIPLIFIAILEIVQHLSDSHNGLIDVAPSGAYSHLVWQYLPAFLLVCIATMYASLDSTVSILTPITALRQGNVSAKRSIKFNTIGRHHLHALFLSLRSRQIVQCLTIVAALVSSFLTVIVSALYKVETVPNAHVVSVERSDFFNWTHVDLSKQDGFAGVLTDLLVYWNTSYPQWTYDDLVFPSMTASLANASFQNSQSASIMVTVPAVRGSLECSTVPSTFINTTAAGPPPDCTTCYDVVDIDYQIALPCSLCNLNCPDPGTAIWDQTYFVPNDSSPAYVGIGTNLQWDVGSRSISGDGYVGPQTNSPGISIVNTYRDNYYPSCPSFSFSLGPARAVTNTHQNTSDGSGIVWTSQQNISIMYCYQRLEQVMTDVTFSYPDFIINQTAPPVPRESTAFLLTQNDTTRWFDISLNTLVGALQSPGGVNGQNPINSFIQALVDGQNGIPIEQLYNNGNLTTLTAAANSLYGKYIAQAISINMRTKVPQPDQIQTPYPATLIQQTQRLQQVRTPKIVLQAMLALMVICAAATWIIMDTKKIVPHNPCSIAGMMSLLADSELCNSADIIPEGSEWKSARVLRREGVLEGLRFRMGWWPRRGGDGAEEKKIFGIDIDGAANGDSDTEL